MMMGGVAVIFLVVVIAAVILGVVLLTAGRGWLSELPVGRPRTPEAIARERYARGEIEWPAYRDTLVNLLKDRYTRGEIELAEYERRVERLLEESASRREEPGRRLEPPASGGERRGDQ